MFWEHVVVGATPSIPTRNNEDFMRDYDKPILNKDGNPLRILVAAAHHCIRCRKKAKAFEYLGYVTHGMGDMISYGTGNYSTYTIWKNERQFKEAIRLYVNNGIDIIEWNNEPDAPVEWIREVLNDINVENRVKLIVDCHDLDSIRKKIIPIPERKLFIYADAVVFASLPIQDIEVDLHTFTKPYVTIYSYCNKDVISYNDNELYTRRGLVYEGGANPPNDIELDRQFSYRSIYGIIKKLVEMGNEVHMFCGNISAYETYQGTGAALIPPTPYDEMMKQLIKYKYGVIIFNNEDGEKDQVNLTLTNKEHEYLQAGLPSLVCWCPETEKHVEKHGTGFVFKHIEEIKDCSQLNDKYQEVMDNIKVKRQELVMENFIWRVENLYAHVLNLEKKGLPDNIRAINEFEFGKEDVERLLR